MDGTAYVLNEPNLNLLGKRQPEIDGRETLSDVDAVCRRAGNELGQAIRFHHIDRGYEQGYTPALPRLEHLIEIAA